MVPRSSVEYLSNPRDSDFTSPVIRSPFRIHTESFCASTDPTPRRRKRPASLMVMRCGSHAPMGGQWRQLAQLTDQFLLTRSLFANSMERISKDYLRIILTSGTHRAEAPRPHSPAGLLAIARPGPA